MVLRDLSEINRRGEGVEKKGGMATVLFVKVGGLFKKKIGILCSQLTDKPLVKETA